MHEAAVFDLDEVFSPIARTPDPVPLKSSQSALLDQAVAALSSLYDERSALLRHPINPGFRPIRESLCYAGLLLVRNGSGHVTDSGLLRACAIIDAVLARQNRNVNGASGGAFPLAWSEQKRSSVMDAEARLLMGALLGLMARRYPIELGAQRVAAIRHALTLILGAEQHQQNDAGQQSQLYQRALRTWLEFEAGDRLRGEELLLTLTEESDATHALARFGSAQAFSLEMFAWAVWSGSDRLADWGGRLCVDLARDLAGSLHPSLQQLFGGSLCSRPQAGNDAVWINAWLSWLTLGSRPLLPRALDNPLDATLFALPALAAIDPEPISDSWNGDTVAHKSQLSRELPDRRISAWFEQNLQVEACHSDAVRSGTEPVVGAFWDVGDTTVRLGCRASGSHRAVCDGRSVRLENPGRCRVSITGLGPGNARLQQDGWELPGLRLTCRGFQISDAERTANELCMTLRPLREQGLLVFSPIDS